MKNKVNYQKICQDLLSDLPSRQKEIISRRFGLNGLQKETLESIGKDLGVSRERVRQIQEVATEKIKSKLDKYQKIFQLFSDYLQKFGHLKKEEILLSDLGGENFKNEVSFLLTLKKPFQKLGEDDDFYSLWFINFNSFELAKKVIHSLFNQLQTIDIPIAFNKFNPPLYLEKEVLQSYLEISKKIQKNQEGLYGLRDWPEINPRGIKDKAYLVLKKIGKPLHFSKVADLIENAHLQTVHNELIKDSRFVLVGRGIYALSEWGYYPGEVKEVIMKVLKEAKKPLSKDEILKKVLNQRQVKENTVLLNLSNKKYFEKDSQGKYLTKVQSI